jgi:D-serine deaminase-like pyridoxal phosphate-dependent protein
MTMRPPAEVGESLQDVDTPALVVDLDILERNLDRMARAVADTGARLRPHAKSHKCPEIALKQIAAGAIGVCCQKVSEAEAMPTAASTTSWSATRSSAGPSSTVWRR